MFDAQLVLDATVLIDLAKAGLLELLAEVQPQPVAVGRTALREARFFRAADGSEHPIDLSGLIGHGVLVVLALEGAEELRQFAAAADQGLDDGEAEVIALAIVRDLVPVTDDGAARRCWESEERARAAIGVQALLQALVAAGRLDADAREAALEACFPWGRPRRP